MRIRRLFEFPIFGPGKRSLLEDFVYYWERQRPPQLSDGNPDLLTVAYYPLRICCSRVASYIEMMKHSIKPYEYSTEPLLEVQIFTKLDSDLTALQVWDRRCLQTLHKIRSVMNFSTILYSFNLQDNPFTMIVEDYEHLAGLVDTYGC